LLLFLQKKKNLSILFFSEEKKQKTFIPWRLALPAEVPRAPNPNHEPPPNKSLFASFSSEKEESFFLVLF